MHEFECALIDLSDKSMKLSGKTYGILFFFFYGIHLVYYLYQK